MDLMGFTDAFLKICEAIAVIGAAMAVIWRCISPAINTKERLKNLEDAVPENLKEDMKDLKEAADPSIKDRIESLERKVENDYDAIMKLHDLNAGMCQAIIALMNHEIDGNNIDGLKKRRDELIKTVTESC